MGTFLGRAKAILEIATAICDNSDLVILIRHDGGMRILDGAGWGLAGLLAEYGAREVYKVERRGTFIRVTGQCLSQTCMLERDVELRQYYPSKGRTGYAIKSHAAPLVIAGSNDCSPQVLNS